ncbi:hypothetical protein POM88_007061 [Heracleum sosnowskyi]|uniref:MULE transposase domain-containing protein n=1 Tax=Heracleum sosnowskyi TaxID=360622 RepID=A0AAD8J616_9APIA|nr:hypothetical protein POM88_007061 [Heracleum sosnowskyi]
MPTHDMSASTSNGSLRVVLYYAGAFVVSPHTGIKKYEAKKKLVKNNVEIKKLSVQEIRDTKLIYVFFQGLEKAVRELLPLVEHRFCARHLSSNLTKKHPSEEVKIAFWSASTATHPEAFKSAMRDLERHSKGAAAKMKQGGHKKGKFPNKPDDYDENTTRKRAPKMKQMTEQEVEIREEIERVETEKETGEAQLMEEAEMEMNAAPTTTRRSQRIEVEIQSPTTPRRSQRFQFVRT